MNINLVLPDGDEDNMMKMGTVIAGVG